MRNEMNNRTGRFFSHFYWQMFSKGMGLQDKMEKMSVQSFYIGIASVIP